MEERMKHNLEKVAKQFKLAGKFVEGEPYGSGHINDTYAVTMVHDATPTP